MEPPLVGLPRLVVASPLTPDAYAPYGDVIMASPHGEEGSPANEGTARRFDWLAAIENLRPGEARLNVSVFRCQPTAVFPFALALLERHPHSTQVFVPMTARRYLVVVARGGDRPDLATLAAFVAGPAQAITYHPGVWHHPMIALDAVTEFTCMVHETSGAGDCDVVRYAEGDRPRVAI